MQWNLKLKISLSKTLKKTMEPQEFCRRWLNADQEMESARGYRSKCVDLLSQVTGIDRETINSKWGAGVKFAKMPKQYQKTLAYADMIREMLASGAKSHPDILDMVMQYLKQSR